MLWSLLLLFQCVVTFSLEGRRAHTDWKGLLEYLAECLSSSPTSEFSRLCTVGCPCLQLPLSPCGPFLLLLSCTDLSALWSTALPSLPPGAPHILFLLPAMLSLPLFISLSPSHSASPSSTVTASKRQPWPHAEVNSCSYRLLCCL